MTETEPDSSFNCTVCMEDRPFSEAVMAGESCMNYHTDQCCKLCTKTYLAVSITENKIAYVKCVSENCPNKFDALHCRDLVSSPQVFEDWLDLLCESSVLGHKRCYCPNLGCRELIIDECPEPPGTMSRLVRRQIKCPNCKNGSCSRCLSTWTDDHRCDDDIIIVMERERWTQCPGCKNYVERNGGCQLITCRCKTRFCYRCGKKQYHCACFIANPTGLLAILLVSCVFFICSLCVMENFLGQNA